MSQENYYNLSNNYNELFDLICKDQEIAAFVDYDMSFDKEKWICRDICRVKRHGPYRIQIGSRGICYSSVEGFENEKGTEKELFISRCEALNLEWISNPI